MDRDTFKNITIQQMEILISLVEAGSFTKAAQRIFLSQPALSKQIKNLEESAGTCLIIRGSRGVTLTPEGRTIYDYAKKVVRLRDEAREKIDIIKKNESGHVYVSASTIPATYILPRLLNHLKSVYPEIRVHIQMNDSEETKQAVLSDQVEIGFIGKEVHDRRLITERLWKDELVLIVSLNHPWAKKEYVSIYDISKESLILREQGSATRAIFEDCLRSKFNMDISSFNVAYELGSSEAVKEAVLAGLGVSVISLFAIKREREQGLVSAIRIKGCLIERNFHVIYKKQFPMLNHHRRFLEVVRIYQPC